MDQTDIPHAEENNGKTATVGAASKAALMKSAALLSTSSAATLRSNSAASIRAFASLRSVTVVSTLLRQAFATGYRNTDKQVRNDLVVLLLLMSREEGARKLLAEVGILDELQQHATYTEMKLLQQSASGQQSQTASTHSINGASTQTPTVGLGKIRALRTSTSSSSSSALPAASFSLTQDFFTVTEDYQLKLLVWHLVSNCVFILLVIVCCCNRAPEALLTLPTYSKSCYSISIPPRHSTRINSPWRNKQFKRGKRCNHNRYSWRIQRL